jgi:peptidoglycan hydrolase-like protein with peptidoglycan-binding domain
MATLLGFQVPAAGAAIGTFAVPGTSVRLSVAREVAPLLIGFARDFDREVEELLVGQCGGFNPRKIAGSSSWSRHAPGVAIDLNWRVHPMGRKNTFPPAKRAKIRSLLDRYSYRGTRVIRWGADFSRPDDMHFEINVPRAVAVAAAKALQAGGTPAAGPKPGSRTLREGDTGADVAFLQRWVGAKDDGRFGPATETRVRRYQRLVGVPTTGVVDSRTWAKILGR